MGSREPRHRLGRVRGDRPGRVSRRGGGGALELGRIASERAALLAAEKERARRLEDVTTRLEEVAALKADFTAMVAHELGYPLSAIRRLTEMLSGDGLDPSLRARALATIIKEPRRWS